MLCSLLPQRANMSLSFPKQRIPCGCRPFLLPAELALGSSRNGLRPLGQRPPACPMMEELAPAPKPRQKSRRRKTATARSASAAGAEVTAPLPPGGGLPPTKAEQSTIPPPSRAAASVDFILLEEGNGAEASNGAGASTASPEASRGRSPSPMPAMDALRSRLQKPETSSPVPALVPAVTEAVPPSRSTTEAANPLRSTTEAAAPSRSNSFVAAETSLGPIGPTSFPRNETERRVFERCAAFPPSPCRLSQPSCARAARCLQVP